jgi:hypothetical protein
VYASGQPACSGGSDGPSGKGSAAANLPGAKVSYDKKAGEKDTMDSFQQADAMMRVYRMKWWKRGIYLVVGAALVGNGVFFCFVVLRHAVHFWNVAGVYGLIGALSTSAMMATGTSILAIPLRSKLVINGTQIELSGLLSERTANLSEIRGFRTDPFGSIRIFLRDGRSKITISSSIDTDDDFRAWLQQLPDLDERDRKGKANA